MTRRDFHRYGSIVLGGLIKLAIAVPAVGIPGLALAEEGQAGAGDDTFETLTSLEPALGGRAAFVRHHQGRTDAWVKYPREPVGSVWLVRQPAGSKPEVIAYHGGVPAPGLRDQPGRRRQGLPLPLPHQRLRLRRQARRTRCRRDRWTGSTSS